MLARAFIIDRLHILTMQSDLDTDTHCLIASATGFGMRIVPGDHGVHTMTTDHVCINITRVYLIHAPITSSPLMPMLHQLKNLVSSNKKFQNHGPKEWHAYFWKYHSAVCQMLGKEHGSDEKEDDFMNFVDEVSRGKVFNRCELPNQLWAAPSAETPPSRLRGGEGPTDTGNRSVTRVGQELVGGNE